MREAEGSGPDEARREGGGHRRGPRIALVASSRLEVYPDALVAWIQGQPADSTLILRRGNKSDPGLFEQVMAKLAQTLWLSVEWSMPDPELGRSGTFVRDVELVRKVDLVLAYFDTTEMSGGTAHVVEKAIDQDVPVFAWGLTKKGFVRVGEHDPHGSWSQSVPD